jgi:RNA polymerase sigma factor (sigma-70 family)
MNRPKTRRSARAPHGSIEPAGSRHAEACGHRTQNGPRRVTLYPRIATIKETGRGPVCKAAMITNESDALLVRAAQRGERDAFAVLLSRHRPLLVALCRRALGNAGLAEDAAQEAALQALLGLDRLRRPERFGAWLAGIGLNVCHRWRRRQGRETWSWEALLGGRIVPEPFDDEPGPDELAEAAEVRRRVRRAVAALPPGQRAAVTLHYLAGLTQAEAAAALGVEVGAVKTRLHKARSALRQQLGASEEETMDERLTRRGLTKATGAAAGIAIAQQLAPGAVDRARAAETLTDGTGRDADLLVEMRIADVRRRQVEGEEPRHHVVLDEVGGERRLLIWLGRFEAVAIALHLERVPMPRPLTYAFAAGLLEAAGGRLREVQIDRLVEETFYATVAVDGPAGTRIVDARPSDALNLALLTGVPIRVAATVLEKTSGASRDTRQPDTAETEGAATIAADVTAGWEKARASLLAER